MSNKKRTFDNVDNDINLISKKLHIIEIETNNNNFNKIFNDLNKLKKDINNILVNQEKILNIININNNEKISKECSYIN